MSDEKGPMPEALRQLGEDAKKRVRKRRSAPTPLNPNPTAEDGFFASPYRQEDWEPWAFLLLEAFGTRSYQVANAFMLNLRAMCPEVWRNEVREKDPHAFEQAVAIVASMRPANEAEAAHAAAMVAVHFTTMQVAERIGSSSYVDPRMANALSGLVRTYTTGMRAMRERKSKARPQVIKVQKCVTVNYDNRQVHLPSGGRPACDYQPQGPELLRAGARDAGELVQCAALLGPDQTGHSLPEAFDQGAEAVPTARVREGRGGPDGKGQRELSARRLHRGSDNAAAGGGGAPEAAGGK